MISFAAALSISLGIWLIYSAVTSYCTERTDSHEVEVYIGDYDEDGNYSGPGRLVTKGGDSYAGVFEKGQLTGLGEYFLARSQTLLYGEFKDGVLSGLAREVRSEGSWFDGRLVRGVKTQVGVLCAEGRTAPGGGGAIYIGAFSDGKRHGRGAVFHPDGSRFEGVFRYGQRDGLGIFYHADGRVVAGVWAKGKKASFSSASPPPALEPQHQPPPLNTATRHRGVVSSQPQT